jgi:ribosome-associated protein
MENTLKEKILQHEPGGGAAATATLEISEARTPFAELDENLKLALHSAGEKKAVNTVVLDLREIASFTEFFVITGGTNQRQVQAIADEIEEQLKKQHGQRPVRIEGYATAEWVLMDYGDFVVHIFDEKSRGFYDLERLWRDAKKVELPADI